MQKTTAFQHSQSRALKALANGENGSEHEVLQLLAIAVISGEELKTDFQQIANAIVAKSVLFEKLPTKKKGRPISSDGVNGVSVALRYFALKDSGMSYADAVARVSAEFHKDERHIMRLVRKNNLIGKTFDDRQQMRKLWKLSEELRQRTIESGNEDPLDFWFLNSKEFDECLSSRDLIAELDDLIKKTLDRGDFTDVNITPFIASD